MEISGWWIMTKTTIKVSTFLMCCWCLLYWFYHILKWGDPFCITYHVQCMQDNYAIGYSEYTFSVVIPRVAFFASKMTYVFYGVILIIYIYHMYIYHIYDLYIHIYIVSFILENLYSISWSFNYVWFCDKMSTFKRSFIVKQGLQWLAVFKFKWEWLQKMTTVCLTI